MFTPEFLKLFIDQTHRPPDIVTPKAEPPHVYLERQADGSLVKITADPPPMTATASDLSTVARLCQEFANNAVAWYTRERVTATLSPDGRTRVTLPLSPSPQLAGLMGWDKAGKTTVTQAGFVRLLRTIFADCYRDYPKLLASVRKLRTTKAAEVNAEIQKGKTSLGKSMIAEMSGIDDIPEEVTFRVPVFAAAALYVAAPVRVCVEPNPEREEFDLTVIPGQIEAAFAAGETWLAAKLSGELADAGAKDVPVYFGQP